MADYMERIQERLDKIARIQAKVADLEAQLAQIDAKQSVSDDQKISEIVVLVGSITPPKQPFTIIKNYVNDPADEQYVVQTTQLAYSTFETIVVSGYHVRYCDRYTSAERAELRHKAIVLVLEELGVDAL